MGLLANLGQTGLLTNLRQKISSLGPWLSSPGPIFNHPVQTEAGWMDACWPMNHGQLAWDPRQGGANSVVYALINLYAKTIAQLPGYHRRERDDNGTDTIKTSALSRVLRKPNDYQTRSDFMFNMVWSLLQNGNAYAVAIRNDRGEIQEIHQLSPYNTLAYVAPASSDSNGGEVFYSVGSNPILDTTLPFDLMIQGRSMVPAREMMHWRVHTPRTPFLGESPLVAATPSIMAQTRATIGMTAYFANMSVPSGVLQTDLILDPEQVRKLREMWNSQTQGANAGGVPILSSGLKWTQSLIGLKAADAQVVETMRYATADIARVFGVPLALINELGGATFSNVEQLIKAWLAQGLGFYLEHIELAFDKFFALETKPDYTEFDVESLLRSDFQARMDGLAKAVTGGIYSPNEARRLEGLPKAKDGDEPRLQAQVVPLTAASLAPAAPSAPSAGGGGDTPTPEPADPPDDESEAAVEELKLKARAEFAARRRRYEPA